MKKLFLTGALLCAFILPGLAQTTGDLKIIDELKAIRAQGAAGSIVSGAANGNPVSIGFYSTSISATFTRPSDTTAYAVSDSVSNSTSAPTVMTFTNAARIADGNGYIMVGRLVKSGAVTTNANFRLYLYNVAPTAINDNAAFTLLWANRAARIGFIDFSSMNTEGTGSDSATALATAVGLKFTCTGSSRNLYGVLVAKAAYTPASAEQFYVEIGIDQN